MTELPVRLAHQPAPAVFLGAFASEVNEPDVLAASFAAVADLTELIVSAVRDGQLPDREAAGHLRGLRLTDADGTQWMLGATSFRWYRKAPGRSWKLAVPPPEADPQCDQSAAAALAGLPAHVRNLAGPGDGLQVVPTPLYGDAPSAGVPLPPPAPWEYEPGGERQLAAGPDPVGPPPLF